MAKLTVPGMGGVFNVVNLHVYHYVGNNPIKYVDPDGRLTIGIGIEGEGEAGVSGEAKVGTAIGVSIQ